ncbi:MAG: CDP-alcohol phosphatidyltransferase family protein [Planctomycetes bacterium]|nr:CDP-alcohol phosphatidyltransferase family protein [Planctomycetota bacterium]
MVFAQTIGRLLSSWRDALARGLSFLGVSPNILTAAGFVFTFLAAAAIAYGSRQLACGFIFLAGAMDMLDGAVAKIGEQKTPFGGVFDSCVDRFSDGAIYTGTMVFFATKGETYHVLATGLALIGAFSTSYVRARAECVIDQCKVGFWERGERTVLIMIGLLAARLATAMWMLALFANWTAIHRIYYTWTRLSKKPGEEEVEEGLPLHTIEAAIYDFIFWRYDRWSWQYDAAVVASIAFLLLFDL